jgi:hypothetical protein
MMEQILKLFYALDWHLVCYGGGSQTGLAFLRKGKKIYRVDITEVDEAVLKEAQRM